MSTETQKWLDQKWTRRSTNGCLGGEGAVGASLNPGPVERLHVLPEILPTGLELGGCTVLLRHLPPGSLRLAVLLHRGTGIVERSEAGGARIEPRELIDQPVSGIARDSVVRPGTQAEAIQRDGSGRHRYGLDGHGLTSVIHA